MNADRNPGAGRLEGRGGGGTPEDAGGETDHGDGACLCLCVVIVVGWSSLGAGGEGTQVTRRRGLISQVAWVGGAERAPLFISAIRGSLRESKWEYEILIPVSLL